MQERRVNEDRMAQLMLDQHRQRIQAQLEKDRQRHLDEISRLQQLREAKKEINSQLRARIEHNQEREKALDEQRIAALKLRRQRREEIHQQKQQEIEQIKAQRQVLY